jgi:sulfatase modifying factor 1
VNEKLLSLDKPSTQQYDGMILVPTGSFMMGCENQGEFEHPVHEVHLDAFWMDAILVTNDQFAEFVQQKGYLTESERSGSAWGYREGRFSSIRGLSWRNYAITGREQHPVVLVSWNDAVAFAKWAGKRLPTEAEWEKAARGGLMGKLYPWGDQEPVGTQSVFARNPSEIPPTSEVKAFEPNKYGLYDMVGNVWQWCNDWYSGDYYSSGVLVNPQGAEKGSHRVRRGGSWNVIQSFRLRCANRGAMDASACAPNVGFRCCVS